MWSQAKECHSHRRKGVESVLEFLGQWLSTFLGLGCFNRVPCVVLTPNQKVILLLLQRCNFATVMTRNVNI